MGKLSARELYTFVSQFYAIDDDDELVQCMNDDACNESELDSAISDVESAEYDDADRHYTLSDDDAPRASNTGADANDTEIAEEDVVALVDAADDLPALIDELNLGGDGDANGTLTSPRTTSTEPKHRTRLRTRQAAYASA